MSELRGRDGGRKLYCEHCGEDIHIVPDFEPEVEYNMEQTLSDIAKEMEPEPAEEGEPVNPEYRIGMNSRKAMFHSTHSDGNLLSLCWSCWWLLWYVPVLGFLIPIIILQTIR